MVERIIEIYCLCDDFLKYQQYSEHPLAQMTNAEVLTTAFVAAQEFGANLEKARQFLKEHHYIPAMLSKSRLNRRLHAIDMSLWYSLFALIAERFKQQNTENEYLIDSIPIPVIDNIRIKRAKLLRGKEFRGFLPSKHRFFYGLKLHLLTTADGKPVELLLSPGSVHDLNAFRQFDFDLPEGACIIADKAYNDAAFEEWLREHAGILLLPQRKANMINQFPPFVDYLQQKARKRIESVFSSLTDLFPRRLRAVTPNGLILKIIAFVIVFALQALLLAT